MAKPFAGKSRYPLAWLLCYLTCLLSRISFTCIHRTTGRYLLDLLTKIQNGCQVHTQQSLSVRGRATVLNSLLLSKLWHVLRVTFFQDKFFNKLRSVMSAFLTHRIFPKISMSTMFLSRILGGLSVLELCVQQCTLQLRWLTPLLSNVLVGPLTVFWSSSQIRGLLALPRLADYLLYHLQVVASSTPRS